MACLLVWNRIWLFELSESLPESTQLHGFDISDEQYPPACSRPNNVQLFVSDVQQGPPEHLQNTYDLVHVRLFLGVVKMDDPSKIIDHAMKLLSMRISTLKIRSSPLIASTTRARRLFAME